LIGAESKATQDGRTTRFVDRMPVKCERNHWKDIEKDGLGKGWAKKARDSERADRFERIKRAFDSIHWLPLISDTVIAFGGSNREVNRT
jgi:hypothetical protein